MRIYDESDLTDLQTICAGGVYLGYIADVDPYSFIGDSDQAELFIGALEDLEFNVRFLGDALGTPYLFWLLSYPVYLVIFLPSIICRKNLDKRSYLYRASNWLRKQYIWDFGLRFLVIHECLVKLLEGELHKQIVCKLLTIV